MPTISEASAYQMIVSGNLPKLTKVYIRKYVIDKNNWADLFATNAEQELRIAMRRHLSALGANISDQLFKDLVINEELLSYCRKKYRMY